jgi:hypothetical protein
MSVTVLENKLDCLSLAILSSQSYVLESKAGAYPSEAPILGRYLMALPEILDHDEKVC